MRVRIQGKALANAWILSLTAGVFSGALCGQQLGANFNGRAGIGSTVSVASLRIPDKARRHFEKAKALADHNRLTESEVESRKAISIAPEFAAAYLLRASTQVREHSFEAALVSVGEARRIEPEAMWASIVLASAYNGLRRYGDAAAELDGLHGAEAESWQAAYEHARAAIGLKDVGGALRWSDAALAGAPKFFGDVYLVRANSFVLAHRWAEAASQMESYMQTGEAAMHRAEVLTILPEIKRLVREEDLRQVAVR